MRALRSVGATIAALTLASCGFLSPAPHDSGDSSAGEAAPLGLDGLGEAEKPQLVALCMMPSEEEIDAKVFPPGYEAPVQRAMRDGAKRLVKNFCYEYPILEGVVYRTATVNHLRFPGDFAPVEAGSLEYEPVWPRINDALRTILRQVTDKHFVLAISAHGSNTNGVHRLHWGIGQTDWESAVFDTERLLAEINSVLMPLGDLHATVIIDACFSGAAISPAALAGLTSIDGVMTSCGSRTVSYTGVISNLLIDTYDRCAEIDEVPAGETRGDGIITTSELARSPVFAALATEYATAMNSSAGTCTSCPAFGPCACASGGKVMACPRNGKISVGTEATEAGSYATLVPDPGAGVAFDRCPFDTNADCDYTPKTGLGITLDRRPQPAVADGDPKPYWVCSVGPLNQYPDYVHAPLRYQVAQGYSIQTKAGAAGRQCEYFGADERKSLRVTLAHESEFLRGLGWTTTVYPSSDPAELGTETCAGNDCTLDRPPGAPTRIDIVPNDVPGLGKFEWWVDVGSPGGGTCPCSFVSQSMSRFRCVIPKMEASYSCRFTIKPKKLDLELVSLPLTVGGSTFYPATTYVDYDLGTHLLTKTYQNRPRGALHIGNAYKGASVRVEANRSVIADLLNGVRYLFRFRAFRVWYAESYAGLTRSVDIEVGQGGASYRMRPLGGGRSTPVASLVLPDGIDAPISVGVVYRRVIPRPGQLFAMAAGPAPDECSFIDLHPREQGYEVARDEAYYSEVQDETDSPEVEAALVSSDRAPVLIEEVEDSCGDVPTTTTSSTTTTTEPVVTSTITTSTTTTTTTVAPTTTTTTTAPTMTSTTAPTSSSTTTSSTTAPSTTVTSTTTTAPPTSTMSSTTTSSTTSTTKTMTSTTWSTTTTKAPSATATATSWSTSP